MARKFVVSIDLLQNELKNAVIQNIGTAPSTPLEGQIYYNNSNGNKTMYFWNGTEWIPTSGSTEVIQDTVSTMIVAGTGLDKTYDDNAGTLTLDIDSTVTTNSGSQTLTNKTIALGNNTVSGTVAQFNTALTDGDFATLAGTETLTNKTLTSPSVSGLYISDGSIVIEGTANDFETTVSADPTADRTITLPDATGTVALLQNKLHDFALATSDVNVNNNKIINVATPVNSTDAANKAYVDAVSEGLHVHQAARVYVSSNIDLSTALEAGDSIDGITLVAGDRVLVNGQTTQSQNGIYVVQASGAAVRALDFDTATEVSSGDFIFVSDGTTYGATGWVQTLKPATIGTDPISFTQFSGAGTYTAGAGLTLSGTVFSVDVTPSAGNASLTNTGGAVEVKVNTNDGLEVTGSGLGINNGAGLTFSAGALVLDTANGYGVRKYATSVGNTTNLTYTVTHNLGTRDVTVQVFENASVYAQVEADVEHTDNNTVTIGFATAPSNNQYRVVVVG